MNRPSVAVASPLDRFGVATAGSTDSHPMSRGSFVPPAAEIKAAYDEGDVLPVELHDGSRLLLRKVAKDYDASNRGAAIEYIRARHRGGEIVTGLLYIEQSQPDLHAVNGTVSVPLAQLPYEQLCPGPDALKVLQKRFR